MANNNSVPKLYQSVVDDVINNVKEAFLDDGVDEQVLLELKQLWDAKLRQSKVLETDRPEVTAIKAPRVVQPAIPDKLQTQAQVTARFPTQLPVINPGSRGLIEMSGAAQTATLALPPALYPQHLAALQGAGGTITLTQGGAQFIIQAAPGQLLQRPGVPGTTAVTMVAAQQPTQTMADGQTVQHMVQLDGANDSSSDEGDDDDDDDDDADKDDDDQNDEENEDHGEEEASLNSADDVSNEEDPAEVFDTENVVVCQFDKINRNKNKWKFHLKDGIMNLNGKDFVFQKANGDAEW